MALRATWMLTMKGVCRGGEGRAWGGESLGMDQVGRRWKGFEKERRLSCRERKRRMRMEEEDWRWSCWIGREGGRRGGRRTGMRKGGNEAMFRERRGGGRFC